MIFKIKKCTGGYHNYIQAHIFAGYTRDGWVNKYDNRIFCTKCGDIKKWKREEKKKK